MRVKVTLACTECSQRNYNTTRIRRTILTELNYRSIVSSVRSTLLIRKLSNIAK